MVISVEGETSDLALRSCSASLRISFLALLSCNTRAVMLISDLDSLIQEAKDEAARVGLKVVTIDCSNQDSSYNKALAISSIFVIFLVSIVGFLAPVFFALRKHPIFSIVVAVFSFVGTAILLTVGFIHILGDAVDDLSSPCLPESFTSLYPSWALLICVITIMLMMLGDYFIHGYIERSAATAIADREAQRLSSADGACTERAQHDADCKSHSTSVTQPVCKEEEGINVEDYHLSASELMALRSKRAVVAVVELSVCTHSIPVGLDLGLQSGSNFVGLFIAIIFHQLLEGLGVGAAVAEARMPFHTALWLSLGFALTCPVGIALGVGLRSQLNENSSTYLFLLGFVNAVASGMLIYTAFLHMNAFSSRGSWLRKQGWFVQLLCCVAFCAAGACMLVVGKWA